MARHACSAAPSNCKRGHHISLAVDWMLADGLPCVRQQRRTDDLRNVVRNLLAALGQRLGVCCCSRALGGTHSQPGAPGRPRRCGLQAAAAAAVGGVGSGPSGCRCELMGHVTAEWEDPKGCKCATEQGRALTLSDKASQGHCGASQCRIRTCILCSTQPSPSSAPCCCGRDSGRAPRPRRCSRWPAAWLTIVPKLLRGAASPRWPAHEQASWHSDPAERLSARSLAHSASVIAGPH